MKKKMSTREHAAARVESLLVADQVQEWLSQTKGQTITFKTHDGREHKGVCRNQDVGAFRILLWHSGGIGISTRMVGYSEVVFDSLHAEPQG